MLVPAPQVVVAVLGLRRRGIVSGVEVPGLDGVQHAVVRPDVEATRAILVEIQEGAGLCQRTVALLTAQPGRRGSDDQRVRVEDVSQHPLAELRRIEIPIEVKGVLAVEEIHEAVCERLGIGKGNRGIVRIQTELPDREGQVRRGDGPRVEVASQAPEGGVDLAGRMCRIPQALVDVPERIARLDERVRRVDRGIAVLVQHLERRREAVGLQVAFPEATAGPGYEPGGEQAVAERGTAGGYRGCRERGRALQDVEQRRLECDRELGRVPRDVVLARAVHRGVAEQRMVDREPHRIGDDVLRPG